VTFVTSSQAVCAYLLLIEAARFEPRSQQMTKFYALIAACAVFAPMAYAALNQAAQIVA
jgi:hypothetical protein